MATGDPNHDAGSRRNGSTIKAAAVEISIYIAVYLAAWVILRVMSAPEAGAAIAPDSSMAPPPAASASTSPAGVDESSPE